MSRRTPFHSSVKEFLQVDPWTTIHGAVNVVTLSVGFLCIGWSEYKIMCHLRQFKSIMSSSALKRQRELHYALIAMAVSPLVSTVIPSSVFLAAAIFGIPLGEYSAFLTIMVSLISLANPITSGYLVKPFRRRVLNTLCAPLGLSVVVAPETVTHPSTGSYVNVAPRIANSCVASDT